MIINHNITSLNTLNKLTSNNNSVSKSLEKLSSGLRINKAGDDAAGLAISEKMRGQIRGLDQASANSQDGISLIQTAEGALSETTAILQRMRELAVQSSTDTNTANDRSKIQSEVDQLAKEITRISNTTEFNTQNLLAGGLNDTFHIGANAEQNISMSINAMDASSLGVAGSTMSAGTLGGSGALSTVSEAGRGLTAATGMKVLVTSTTATAGTVTKNAVADSANTSTLVIGASGSFTGTTDTTYTVKVAGVTSGTTGNEISSIQYSKDNGTSWTTVTADFGTAQTIDGLTFTMADSAVGKWTAGDTLSFTATAAKSTLQLQTSAAVNIGVAQTAHYGDTSVTIGDSTTGKTIKAGFTFSSIQAVASGTSTFNVTASSSSAATVVDGKVNTNAVAAAGINVSDQTNANSAITTIDNAIQTVSTERSKLGAYQNRLEHTINNLSTSSENITAAESRVRDVNMAKEMTNFQKNSILSQAATAMLAQANQQPQGVLQLLK